MWWSVVPLSYEPLSSVSSCICPHVPSPLSNPASVSRPVFRGDVSNVCCCGGGQWFLCHMDPSRLFPRVFVFNLGYNTSVCRPLFRGDVSTWFRLDPSRLFPLLFFLSGRLLMLRRDVSKVCFCGGPCVCVFILFYGPLASVSSCICPHVPSPQSNPASVSRPVFPFLMDL